MQQHATTVGPPYDICNHAEMSVAITMCKYVYTYRYIYIYIYNSQGGPTGMSPTWIFIF